MKNLVRLSIVLLLIGCFVGLAWANKACETPDGEFSIMISPKTIVLSSPCDTITVHSNIPFGAVVDGSVVINDVYECATFADDCGDLVARIGVEALDGILVPGEVITLTLSGELIKEGSFAVDETITVKK
jgi:hypothetical protein